MICFTSGGLLRRGECAPSVMFAFNEAEADKPPSAWCVTGSAWLGFYEWRHAEANRAAGENAELLEPTVEIHPTSRRSSESSGGP
jgi:hypothetical protein